MATSLSTYNTVGIREDLSDLISNITPTNTPFQIAVRKGKVKNTVYEWQTDEYAPALANNAQIEGFDAPSADHTPTVRQRNYTQILSRSVKIQNTADAVDKAGRATEFARELSKKTKEIKRDLESSLCQNTVAVAGDGSTARKFKGLEGWVGYNQSLGASGVAPNPEANAGLGSAPTDGTTRAFTETLLKNVLNQIENSGGEPNTIMVGTGNRTVFSTFGGVATSTTAPSQGGGVVADAKDGKIYATMDVYESDWGTLRVVANKFQRNRTAFVLDPKGFELVTLRPLETVNVGIKGDYREAFLVMEMGLKCDNWKAHGAVRDLT